MFSDRKKSTSINDKEFQIYMLPMGKGMPIAMTLATTVLPALGDVLGAGDNGGEAEMDFASVATTLVTQLGKLDVMDLIQTLLKELTVDGNEVVLDDYFRANYGELVEVLAFSLTENFSSFFAAKGLLTRFMG